MVILEKMAYKTSAHQVSTPASIPSFFNSSIQWAVLRELTSAVFTLEGMIQRVARAENENEIARSEIDFTAEVMLDLRSPTGGA